MLVNGIITTCLYENYLMLLVQTWFIGCSNISTLYFTELHYDTFHSGYPICTECVVCGLKTKFSVNHI